jgi:hypothetical protein
VSPPTTSASSNINKPLSSSRRRIGFGGDLGFIDPPPLATTLRQGEVWTRPAFRAARPVQQRGKCHNAGLDGRAPTLSAPSPRAFAVSPTYMRWSWTLLSALDMPAAPQGRGRGTLTTHRLLGYRIADRGIVGVGTHVDYDGVVDAVGEETLA